MNRNGDNGWTQFSDLNLAYLAELYERYQADPASVDAGTRRRFEQWGPPVVESRSATAVAGRPAAPSPVDQRRLAALMALTTAIRMYGHHAARLDPLGGDPPGDTSLLPETHGLTEADLAALPADLVGGAASQGARNALEAIRALREIYQGTSGYEFEHITNDEERDWLFNAAETGQFAPPSSPIDERKLLELLTKVEAFEKFLHTAFPTQSRFSIEGLEMLVPMLDEVLGAAGRAGTRTVVLGMPHRGRLNILAHVLDKPYEDFIAEFQGGLLRPDFSETGGDRGWTGDVKYHMGGGKEFNGASTGMRVVVPSNPSHLEYVDPVVEGMTRAASERRDQPGPARMDENAALAVLVHGDAAFSGLGVVAETFNLSRLPGYRTGGTVHFIGNNQLGFTATPADSRSTLFASDVAKGYEVPVVHVNADDPVACVAAARLAHAYVHRFHKDVLVDVVGYRKWGHNEGDEPSFTQPRMYAIIGKHPTVRTQWAEQLVRRGVVAAEEAEASMKSAMDRLQSVRRSLPKEAVPEPGKGLDQAGLEAGGVMGGVGDPGPARDLETSMPVEAIQRLNEELLALPEGFNLYPKLKPLLERRRAALAAGEDGRGRIDWGHAEVLAFASILSGGTPIRLTGEDSERGTFSQRHAVLHDVETGARYVPLQRIPSARASFDVWNSPLTEQATLGFEYGYNLEAQEALVLWEAQYGDFVNGAQVFTDTFVTAGRSKWGLTPSLVMLLPHAYEGQGPEHSSARLERFLQMAAEDNLRIANCTTAAQYFHILRRQAKLLELDPRPLVLLTPKSLLRHPLASSSPLELSEGRFAPVIDDAQAGERAASIERAILCSGKVFVDLVAYRQAAADGSPPNVPAAIIRLEELYPFPAEELRSVLDGYPNLREIVWAQEEPRNMGAWTYVAPRLRDLTSGRLPLYYAGRTRRSSPAEGSHDWHVREQKRLVAAAFSPAPEASRVKTEV